MYNILDNTSFLSSKAGTTAFIVVSILTALGSAVDLASLLEKILFPLLKNCSFLGNATTKFCKDWLAESAEKNEEKNKKNEEITKNGV